MSDTYITYGAIVELKNPINFEEFQERRDIEFGVVGITYNGKFLYTLSFYEKSWEFEFKIFDVSAILEEQALLRNIAKKYGIEILGEIKPYIQQYYSGTDHTIDMIEEI